MNSLSKLIIFIIILTFTKNINAKNDNKILFSISNNIFTSIDLNKRFEYINIKENKTIQYDDGILEDYISVLLFNKYYDELQIKDNLIDIVSEQYRLIIKNIDSENNYLNEIIKKISENELKKNITLDYKRKIIIENELRKQNELIFNNNINKINNPYIPYKLCDKVISSNDILMKKTINELIKAPKKPILFHFNIRMSKTIPSKHPINKTIVFNG